VYDRDVHISQLVLCKGWDADENAIPFPDDVPATETRICICGDLETPQDVSLQVMWTGGGKIWSDNRQVFGAGQFLHCIEQEGYEPGNYRAAVIMMKEELGRVDFVVQP
jgi:hypothetical protein